MNPVRTRRLLLALFFLSGVAGLIYESIWTHYLKLFLGHAAYAQTLVLAIFMGGMALGAWLASRLTPRWKNPLLAYALVEGMIGIAALLFHPLFVESMRFSFDTAIPALPGPAAIHLYKWGTAAVMILPQTILLGMTFPLMSGGVLRLYPDTPGGLLSWLYFTNSAGGALGVLASGFFTIDRLGLDGTLAAAGMLNLLLALLIAWRFRDKAPPLPPPRVARPDRSRLPALLLAIACLTGAASFVYEITWLRMLGLVLGASTHAFELMLSAFILGLACGGWWLARRADRLTRPLHFLAVVQLLMGAAALATLPLYGHAFHLMEWLLSVLTRDRTGYLLFNLASHGIAMAIMFPAAFCAGMTLPLITRVLMAEGSGEKEIGRVYGINTLGAILGILFTVHLALPLLGVKGALMSGAALDIGLGLLLVPPGWRRVAWPVAVLLLIATARLVELNPHLMASGVYRDGKLLSGEQRVLSHTDGKTATVSLTASQDNVYSLRTNGKIDASISMPPTEQRTLDEVTMTLTGALPLLLHPAPRFVANIGLGSGMTSHVALADPRLQRLDTIEIEPAIVEAARRFSPYNDRLFADPRGAIHIEDAKTFFSTRRARYDIIISEPSNPWVSGVAGLFTREFYRDIKRHLAPGGMVAQWLQVYEFDLGLLQSVLKAVAAEYPHFTIYAVDHGDLLILASGRPIPDLADQDGWPVAEMAADLARVGVHHPQDLRLRWVGDERFFAPFLRFSPAPANSDYAPYVDQHAARARFLGGTANAIFFPVNELLPLRPLLAGRESSAGGTRVTPTALSPFAVGPFVASELLARLTGRSRGSTDHPNDIQTHLDKMIRALAECRVLPAHGDKVYLLYQLAVPALPYLHPVALEQLLTAMQALPCGQGLQGHEAGWMRLFAAIGRRDPAAMETEVVRLIEAGAPLTKTRGAYLFGVGMLALLAQNRHQEALAFWDRHFREKIEPRHPPALVYQYLRAVAEAGASR
ncbi:MAG: spermidine synthase [Magnetococcales bacterium]|nr:spermidine synthase [Magnetococcales bacterium]